MQILVPYSGSDRDMNRSNKNHMMTDVTVIMILSDGIIWMKKGKVVLYDPKIHHIGNST